MSDVSILNPFASLSLFLRRLISFYFRPSLRRPNAASNVAVPCALSLFPSSPLSCVCACACACVCACVCACARACFPRCVQDATSIPRPRVTRAASAVARRSCPRPTASPPAGNCNFPARAPSSCSTRAAAQGRPARCTARSRPVPPRCQSLPPPASAAASAARAGRRDAGLHLARPPATAGQRCSPRGVRRGWLCACFARASWCVWLRQVNRDRFQIRPSARQRSPSDRARAARG